MWEGKSIQKRPQHDTFFLSTSFLFSVGDVYSGGGGGGGGGGGMASIMWNDESIERENATASHNFPATSLFSLADAPGRR